MQNSKRTRNAITVVGSMNMDLSVSTHNLPKPGETVVGGALNQSPGGKGANQAVAAALLGAKVSLIAMTGDDSFGKALVDSALSAGVDTSLVQVDFMKNTGTAVITVDSNAENTIVISPGANQSLSPSLAKACLFNAGEISVLSACMEVPHATVEEALRTGRELGAMTILNLSPFDRTALNLLPLADVLLVNRHELEEIVGEDVVNAGWLTAKASLGNLGSKSVVVTLGAEGAVILECDKENSLPLPVQAFKVQPVDTTGCGDAFAGAICSELAAGATLQEAAEFAAKVASYAARFPGAQNSYGTRAQILSS